jgi:hypothetical protein
MSSVENFLISLVGLAALLKWITAKQLMAFLPLMINAYIHYLMDLRKVKLAAKISAAVRKRRAGATDPSLIGLTYRTRDQLILGASTLASVNYSLPL